MGLLEISFSSSYVDRLYKDIKSLRCNDIVATDLIKRKWIDKSKWYRKKKKEKWWSQDHYWSNARSVSSMGRCLYRNDINGANLSGIITLRYQIIAIPGQKRRLIRHR